MSAAAIDINDPTLVAEPVDDVDGASFFAARVPDDGDHLVRLELGQNGIKPGKDKRGNAFLNVHFAERIYDENGNEQGYLFDRVNSVVFDRNGQRFSRLHALMDLVGVKLGNASEPEKQEMIETALADNPEVVATSQWQAQSKAETDEEVEEAIRLKFAKPGKLEVGWYYTFLKNQRKFPKGSDGTPIPEAVNPITGEKVRAQAVVTGYKPADQR